VALTRSPSQSAFVSHVRAFVGSVLNSALRWFKGDGLALALGCALAERLLRCAFLCQSRFSLSALCMFLLACRFCTSDTLWRLRQVMIRPRARHCTSHAKRGKRSCAM
jgi:hypothetical protein